MVRPSSAPFNALYKKLVCPKIGVGERGVRDWKQPSPSQPLHVTVGSGDSTLPTTIDIVPPFSRRFNSTDTRELFN